MPLDRRRAGVLLHPTSLPGATLGADARRFVDFLAAGGFTVWQVLPLGPVDDTCSPYQLRSAFAGNTGLLDASDLSAETWWPLGAVAEPGRLGDQAWMHFRRYADNQAWDDFAAYRMRNASWLMPYALFTVLGQRQGQQPWWEWPEDLRHCDRAAIATYLKDGAVDINAIMFGQYLFDRQWIALRDYARTRNVRLFGDLPFYVDRNSTDVWWRRSVFRVDPEGHADAVSGVPPDYFNADGQLWGNPLYDWSYLQADGFRWWLARLSHQASRFDLLRIDHFRALEACWTVPAGATTARDGSWEAVPGDALLAAVRDRLPKLALVAEDLGTITNAVTALRDKYQLPGMLVLQFAFDGSDDNPYLPANHVENAVVYTGTHDNDTSCGWFASLDEGAREFVSTRLGHPDSVPAALVDAACASPARLAMLPMQDLLGLGSEARMNTPGTVGGNWGWQFQWSQVDAGLAQRCAERNAASGRTTATDSVTRD